MKLPGFAGIATLALALGALSAPTKAGTVTDIISFTDVGTYGFHSAFNGAATVSGSFTIAFDPSVDYLTQPLGIVVTNLSYSVTDDRFGGNPNLTFNPIKSFEYIGGALSLFSDPVNEKSLDGTPNIAIGINGWILTPASDVWYSQTGFQELVDY